MLVLSLIAVVFGLSHFSPNRYAIRIVASYGIVFAAILIHSILPPGHGLAEAIGGSAESWVLVLALGTAVWLYLLVFGAVRRKAQARQAVQEEPTRSDTLTEAELERYARHIVLREVGGAGQKKLQQARVLVIGAGGLGSAVLPYLAAAGVGTIGVIDDDEVDVSNLQRQVIHHDADIGKSKVVSAAEKLAAQNPHILVRPYNRRFTDAVAAELLNDYDLVLDGSDNFDTRYLANATCVQAGKPLISGALSQWEGQVAVFHPLASGPCYSCIFPQAPDPDLVPSCAAAGVFAPLPGIIGTMMASEAVKLITGAGQPLLGRMAIFDALESEMRVVKTKARTDCPVCHAAVKDT